MKNKSILVVEDENIVALDLRILLRTFGYDILAIVPSGEEAIEKANRLHPDLILMDIRLKGKMNGLQAAKSISSNTNIPIIFLTSHSDPDTLAMVSMITPYGCIIKPYSEYDIKEKIHAALF